MSPINRSGRNVRILWFRLGVEPGCLESRIPLIILLHALHLTLSLDILWINYVQTQIQVLSAYVLPVAAVAALV